MRHCPQCNLEITNPQARFCKRCGLALPSAEECEVLKNPTDGTSSSTPRFTPPSVPTQNDTPKRHARFLHILPGVLGALIILLALGWGGKVLYDKRQSSETAGLTAQKDFEEETYQPEDVSEPHDETMRGASETPVLSAFGHFQQDFMEHGSGNRLSYKGNFIFESTPYPIELTFEVDENTYPTRCTYHNVNYDVTIVMNVEFTETTMLLSGDAGGSAFRINVSPETNSHWKGKASSGAKVLDVEIWPA